jgi:uncharacterized protein YjiS (DUF1127 family)
MSLINLFVAARNAMARRRQRRCAMDELMALDDRSLADIGIHRSQISGVVEGFAANLPSQAVVDGVTATAFGRSAPRLATGRSWLPPL